jgi:hypothetical protein
MVECSWVGAGKKYTPGSTSVNTRNQVVSDAVTVELAFRFLTPYRLLPMAPVLSPGRNVCDSINDTSGVTYLHPCFSVTDTVTLGTGLVIKGQSIGVASKATGFQDVDGILGLVVSIS